MISNWIGYWFFWFIKRGAGPAPSTDALLQEDGSLLLQENGDKILL